MIEIDVLFGLGTLKATTGVGKIQTKEFNFIKLRREGICVKIAMTDMKGVNQLQELLDEIKRSIHERTQQGLHKD